jgi:GMP synthase-like glutamine amidotransferase
VVQWKKIREEQPSMNIHILQHVPFEGSGSIEDWALMEGHPISITRFYAQEPFPALERFDLLVVMGGPMSIHDEHLYSWLKGEKWFIKQVIEAGKPVLGICLGAQLIAEVLGGEVYQGEQKEIGWLPVELDESFTQHPLGQKLPREMNVFHWHGETFTLPPGAQRIASSVACENQGFIYQDQVIALQFHLETTPFSAQSIVEHGGDELVDAPYIQSAGEILGNTLYYSEINGYMRQVIEYLQAKAGRTTD